MGLLRDIGEILGSRLEMFRPGLPRVIGLVYLWTCVKIFTESAEGITPRGPSEEERLLGLLFDGYNPSARPVLNSSHTVDVRMQFSLLQVQELNLRNQVLSTTGLLILEWHDERLRWDPTQLPPTEIVVESKKLWRPEFASINGADGIYGDYGQFRAIVTNMGKVHWEPGGVFKTVCEIDITYYPFDEQKCRLVFGAWSYHTTKMNLTNMEDVVNMDSFEENGEWEIHTTEVIREEFAFECCPLERFANVQFVLYMKRRYTFYIMNVILPSLMTSVLLLSIFFCTPAQKVQIGVVVLLSFRIFLLNVTDSIPKTSDHIPLLGIYLTCTMAITTLSMVLTVFILNLHHITDRPVPKWLRRLVLVYLARLLCMCQYQPPSSSSAFDSDDEMDNNSKYRVTPNSLGQAIGSQIGILASLNGTLGNGSPAQTNNRAKKSTATRSNSHGGGGNNVFVNPHGVHYSSGFSYADDAPREKVDVKRLEEEWGREWRHLAEVVDRLFFWLFLSAIVITTLLLFHPLTKAYFSLLGDETILRGQTREASARTIASTTSDTSESITMPSKT